MAFCSSIFVLVFVCRAGSSVGRATDWKSVCRRFKSAPAHYSKLLAARHLYLAAFFTCHPKRPNGVNLVSIVHSFCQDTVQQFTCCNKVFRSHSKIIFPRRCYVRMPWKCLNYLNWQPLGPIGNGWLYVSILTLQMSNWRVDGSTKSWIFT